ncbi:MAG TPA: class I SAM-dependent methyltransferase [Methylomirabilota bacterium]|jgi:demethylmenaquinone methyltransferase / 2-methoxy-6-polyprenyl-1,4-benzoquinol methylase|nr:class I SAM-dependent methyltransferase [Methylomirabilota bacterium]
MAPTNSEQRDTKTVVPPHPVLNEYYSRPDERQGFVADLFDGCARYYNRVGTMLDFGSGRWYRRDALRRAGLRKGMRLLDVAAGTGLMTRGGVDITGKENVVGVDPSQGMLGEAKKAVTAPLVRGRAEALPFRSERFDMLSMGFALRHVPDLGIAFREYFRILKPGGRIILLETPRPETRFGRWFVKTHFQRVLPWMARVTFRNEPAQLLMKFYWDTIDQCVPPETILAVLRKTGFVDVKLQRTYLMINEYTATRPLK